MSEVREQIELANRKVLDILKKGQPRWIGCKDALDAIPGMTPKTILHAGPPISWERMCQPMRNGIIGAVIYEGLASIPAEAEALIVSGEVDIHPCHEYMAVGGMTGVTSASTPVHIVVNDPFGVTAFCGFHEGGSPNGFGWGTYDDESLQHLRWMKDELAPVLDAGLQAMGGLNMQRIVARAIQMGDEEHGRCGAATSLIVRELIPCLVQQGFDPKVLTRVLEFLRTTDIFALHVIMAAGRSLVEPAKNIPFSTVVTTMARNGVEFGIKVSALGDRWFTGPAQNIRTVYFSTEWTDDDANPDIGDSSIVETVGLGGLIHAAAPAHEFALGGVYTDSLVKTQEAYAFCAGEHDTWVIPSLDFRGVPLGIDIRKVLNTGVTPILDTATVHKHGGKIGIGEARAPQEAFEAALRAFSESLKAFPA